MSPFGEHVATILGELFAGIYHIKNAVMKADFTQRKRVRVCISDLGSQFTTYDTDLLTRMVIIAHRENVRIAINAAAHRYLWITFQIVDHSGFFADHHPTIEDLVFKINPNYQLVKGDK